MRSTWQYDGELGPGFGERTTYVASLGALVIVLGALAWLVLQVPQPAPPGAYQLPPMVRVRGGLLEVPSEDGPVTVRVRTLEVDRKEVTVGDFQACIAAGACSPRARREPRPECNFDDPMRWFFPMNCVSVKDAIDHCQWRDARLPTTNEWEYLARGYSGAWQAGVVHLLDGVQEWACDVRPEQEEHDDVVCWTFAEMGASTPAPAERSGPTRYWRDGYESSATGFRCVR